MNTSRLLFLMPCFLLMTVVVQAENSVVTLKSGERVIGQILPASSPKTVVVRSRFLGEIKLLRSTVVSIKPKPASPKPASPKPPTAAKTAKAPAAGAAGDELQILEALKAFKAPEDWAGYLRLGINMSQGDEKWTETYTRARLVIKPKLSPNYFRYTGSYTYRETERVNGAKFKSTDKYDGEITYRRDLLKNWLIQSSATARVDQIKGINHEIMGTLGLGYTCEPFKNFTFLVGAGGGLEDVKTANDDTRNGVNLNAHIFQEANWKIHKRTSFVQSFNYYWNPEDAGNYKYVLSAALRIRLTDLLGFQFSYEKSYDNDVRTTNLRDDTQWRNALVLFF